MGRSVTQSRIAEGDRLLRSARGGCGSQDADRKADDHGEAEFLRLGGYRCGLDATVAPCVLRWRPGGPADLVATRGGCDEAGPSAPGGGRWSGRRLGDSFATL